MWKVPKLRARGSRLGQRIKYQGPHAENNEEIKHSDRGQRRTGWIDFQRTFKSGGEICAAERGDVIPAPMKENVYKTILVHSLLVDKGGGRSRRPNRPKPELRIRWWEDLSRPRE